MSKVQERKYAVGITSQLSALSHGERPCRRRLLTTGLARITMALESGDGVTDIETVARPDPRERSNTASLRLPSTNLGQNLMNCSKRRSWHVARDIVTTVCHDDLPTTRRESRQSPLKLMHPDLVK
jgi:hypothetical protein